MKYEAEKKHILNSTLSCFLSGFWFCVGTSFFATLNTSVFAYFRLNFVTFKDVLL